MIDAGGGLTRNTAIDYADSSVEQIHMAINFYVKCGDVDDDHTYRRCQRVIAVLTTLVVLKDQGKLPN
jgi:hypothetical protein